MKNNINTAVNQSTKMPFSYFKRLPIAVRDAYVAQLNRKLGITKGYINIL